MSLRTVTFRLQLAVAAIAAVSLVASGAYAQKKKDADSDSDAPKKKKKDADADTKKADADADADADAAAAAAAAAKRREAKRKAAEDAAAAASTDDDDAKPVVKKKPKPEKSDDDKTNHERVVGHFGFSWFGVSSIPLGIGSPTGTTAVPAITLGTPITVSAPAVGIRYWLSNTVGIDAGIGLGYTGGSVTNNNVSVDKLGAFGFLIHAGLPLALASGKHISLQLTPETNLGFSHAAVAATVENNAPPAASLGGVRFDLGARIGGEIQFGFIGIPELALEGSIGAFFTYQQSSVTVGSANNTNSSIALTTANFHDPWDFFTSVVAARYYF